MHLWPGYPPYRNLLKGRHLPAFCHDRKLVTIDFKVDSPVPTFTGVRKFPSCIYNISFTGTSSLPDMLQAKGSIQGDYLLGGCYQCNLPCESL